jgi:hypothetical protein
MLGDKEIKDPVQSKPTEWAGGRGGVLKRRGGSKEDGQEASGGYGRCPAPRLRFGSAPECVLACKR